MVEVLNPLIVQVNGRHHHRQRDGDYAEDRKNAPIAGDYEVGEPFQGTFAQPAAMMLFAHAHGQQADHRWQERQRQRPGGGNAGSRNVAQIMVRR